MKPLKSLLTVAFGGLLIAGAISTVHADATHGTGAKPFSVLHVTDGKYNLKTHNTKLQTKGLNEAETTTSLDGVDVIMVPEEHLKEIKDLVRKGLDTHRFIVVYDEHGHDLTPDKLYRDLDINGLQTSQKDPSVHLRTPAIALYNDTQGFARFHELNTQKSQTLDESYMDLEEMISEDLKDFHPSTDVSLTENHFSASYIQPNTYTSTPGPIGASNTITYKPYGKVTMTRSYTATRINNNTETVWVGHYDYTTNPGDNLYYNVGDTTYGAGWYTDTGVFRSELCSGCTSEAVQKAGPNGTSSGSIASVNIGFGGVSASWNFAAAGVGIANVSNLPQYGRWTFTYSGNAATYHPYDVSPGVEVSNTSGNFLQDVSATTNWTSLIGGTWTEYTGTFEDSGYDF